MKKIEDLRNEYIKKFDGYFPNMGLSEDKEVEIIEKCLKEERNERKKIKKLSVRDNVNIAYRWNINYASRRTFKYSFTKPIVFYYFWPIIS